MIHRSKLAATAVAALALGAGGVALWSSSRPDPAADGTLAVTTPTVVAVMVGGDATLDACAGLATVGPGGAAVRAGPGDEHPVREVLDAGRGVIVCDHLDRWTGIVYPTLPDAPLDCGIATPSAAAAPYAGPCRSGWVADAAIAGDAG